MVERGIDGQWNPVVMDFGLAREGNENRGITESGAVLGTPAYMSPEQARGDVRLLDRRADVYSLGATLYDLVLGKPPFSAETVVDIIFQVIHQDPPSLREQMASIPLDLETIILKCLSKEPEQRYQSAQQLADELWRYVQGEPIIGKRTSLTYRLRRTFRRNRALVSVSALSVFAILTLLGYSVRSRVLASREKERAAQHAAARAQLSQQLGQDIKDIEWLLRSSYQLPLHDSTHEQKITRRRMEEIDARKTQIDPSDTGLIQYALGRGHLALHGLEAAQSALLESSNQGIDIPELHYALGYVLGQKYQQELTKARRSGDKSWLLHRQKELEQQFLAPALASLNKSRGAKLDSPDFLEALIAYYHKKYETAIQKAKHSISESPWLYESHKLIADVQLEQAIEQRDHGDYKQAKDNLSKSIEQYKTAIQIGRSDASIYNALAEAWIQQSQLDSDLGSSPQNALNQALSACQEALAASPNDQAAYTKKAYAYFWLAWDKLITEKDPRPEIALLIKAGQRAIELDPQDEMAFDAMGNGYSVQGNYERDIGLDPTASWLKATIHLKKAIEVAPKFPWAPNDLGLVYQEQGRWLMLKGQDPQRELQQAISAFQQAVSIDPDYIYAYNNIVMAHGFIAQYLASRGQDPEREIQAAATATAKAISINKNAAFIYSSKGYVGLQKAQYLSDAGRDPSAAIADALGPLATSLTLAPGDPRSTFWRCKLLFLQGQYALQQGNDPMDSTSQGHMNLQVLLRNQPSDADALRLDARLRLLEATWNRKRGQPQGPLLQQALVQVRQALTASPSHPDAMLTFARVILALAEASPTAIGPSQLNEAQALLDRLLRANPNDAHGHALRAAILYRQALLLPHEPDRAALQKQASAALQQAFSINPLLRGYYADVSGKIDAKAASARASGSQVSNR